MSTTITTAAVVSTEDFINAQRSAKPRMTAEERKAAAATRRATRKNETVEETKIVETPQDEKTIVPQDETQKIEAPNATSQEDKQGDDTNETSSQNDTTPEETNMTLTADRQTEIISVLDTARADIATITETGLKDNEEIVKSINSIRALLTKITKVSGESAGTKGKLRNEDGTYVVTLTGVQRLFEKTGKDENDAEITEVGVVTIKTRKGSYEFAVIDGVHMVRTWNDAYELSNGIVQTIKKDKKVKLTGDWRGAVYMGVHESLPVMIIGCPPKEKIAKTEETTIETIEE